MTTGEKIKSLRKERGLTQKELGQILGVSASMIGQYETNLRNPKNDTIIKIAEALKVSPDQLFGLGRWVAFNADFAETVAAVFTSFKIFLDDERIPEDIRSTYSMALPDFEKTLTQLPEIVAMITTASVFNNKYALTDEKKLLISLFDKLNDAGKTAVLDRIVELTEIPRYQQTITNSVDTDNK